MKECVSTSDSSSSSHKDMTNIQAESFTFKPDLRMDELSVAEKEKAQFVYPRVTEDIARKIDEEVRNQSKQALSILPHTASAKLREKTYRQWLHARYVQIVSDCVEVGASPPPFIFVPQVAVQNLSEEAQRSRAQELVQAVGAKDVCHIEEAIRRRRTEWEAKMPPWMIDVSEEIWKELLHGEYYDIIDSILSKKRDSGNVKKDDGDRKEKRSSEMVAPPNAMAFSPGKRIRSQSSSTPMEYLEACEIHLREQCIGEEYAFEGYLLFAPETIKTVELPDYKTHGRRKDSLLTCLLSDHSAPLLCKFWGKMAGQALTKLSQWITKHPGEEKSRPNHSHVCTKRKNQNSNTNDCATCAKLIR